MRAPSPARREALRHAVTPGGAVAMLTVRNRTGGALARMIDAMVAEGWLERERPNRATAAGLALHGGRRDEAVALAAAEVGRRTAAEDGAEARRRATRRAVAAAVDAIAFPGGVEAPPATVVAAVALLAAEAVGRVVEAPDPEAVRALVASALAGRDPGDGGRFALAVAVGLLRTFDPAGARP